MTLSLLDDKGDNSALVDYIKSDWLPGTTHLHPYDIGMGDFSVMYADRMGDSNREPGVVHHRIARATAMIKAAAIFVTVPQAIGELRQGIDLPGAMRPMWIDDMSRRGQLERYRDSGWVYESWSYDLPNEAEVIRSLQAERAAYKRAWHDIARAYREAMQFDQEMFRTFADNEQKSKYLRVLLGSICGHESLDPMTGFISRANTKTHRHDKPLRSVEIGTEIAYALVRGYYRKKISAGERGDLPKNTERLIMNLGESIAACIRSSCQSRPAVCYAPPNHAGSIHGRASRKRGRSEARVNLSAGGDLLQSVIPAGHMEVLGHEIKLPLKMYEEIPPRAAITGISLRHSNRYGTSIHIGGYIRLKESRVYPITTIRDMPEVGVDFGGGHDVAILSDGTKIPNHDKAEDIKIWRGRWARWLVANYSFVAFENISSNGMDKSYGWRLLADKVMELAAKSRNTKVHIIRDRYFASTQTCSGCGYRGPRLGTSIREWTCKSCEVTHDRDVNAAINVLKKAKEEHARQ